MAVLTVDKIQFDIFEQSKRITLLTLTYGTITKSQHDKSEQKLSDKNDGL